MAREPGTNDVAPPAPQQDRVAPDLVAVVLIALVILLSLSLGWWEAEPTGNLPAD